MTVPSRSSISLLDGLPAIYWQYCFSLYQLVNTYRCMAVEKWLYDTSCSYQLCQWLVFCVHWELVCHVMSWNIYITHAWAAILSLTLGGATRSRVRIIALLYLASYHYRKLVSPQGVGICTWHTGSLEQSSLSSSSFHTHCFSCMYN